MIGTKPLKRRAVVKSLMGLPMVAIGPRIDLDDDAITPEMFGARGDGLHADGPALCDMVDHINQLASGQPVTVRCVGHYLIGGGRSLPYPITGATDKGHVQGIPTVTKDKVTWDARGATFIVAASLPWRRLKRGGDERDSFAQGICVTGEGFRMIGGTLDGNLNQRTIMRGPRERNFGGMEFGLCMLGRNWLLSQVVSANWGTDSLMVGAPGSAAECSFETGRRNSVSIVANAEVPRETPVVFDDCEFLGASRYAPHEWNAPGSGLHVEGKHAVTVVVRECRAFGNRRNAMRFSTGASHCVVENCTVDSNVEFRSTREGHRGGHQLERVVFNTGAHVIIQGHKRNAPMRFDRCTFNGWTGSPIICREKFGQYQPNIHVIDCHAPDSSGFDLPAGQGHVLQGNRT